MPPWMVELLMQHNSRGFADTLSQLAKVTPIYRQVADQREGNMQVAAQVKHGEGLTPYLDVTPFLAQKFGQTGTQFRSGYKALDPNQKMGDKTLAHEFGHIIASGVNNPQLAEQFLAIDPTIEDAGSEQFGDDFQQAVQFLRNPQADTTKLSPRQALITNVLLQQPIYAQHPINQRRMLQQILMGQLNR